VDGTVENSDPNYAGNNTITAGQGNNRILGGTGNNTITTGDGRNIIFGADGELTFVDDIIEGDSTLLAFSGQTYIGSDGWNIYANGLLLSAVSIDTTIGGTETIVAGVGQNLIVGGYGSANITACDGQNIIIGGLGTNTITGGNGENIVFGADGGGHVQQLRSLQCRGSTWDAVEDTVYASAQSIYQTLGGNDTITLGTGNVVVFGGSGNDSITTGGTVGVSNYVIFGGDGQVVFSPGGWVTSANLVFPNFTGMDTMTIGSSAPVVLQGVYDELISNLQSPTPQMASGPAPTGEDTSPGLTESQLQAALIADIADSSGNKGRWYRAQGWSGA
jgi:Ca2+-binding RTX toxin-like protein